MIRLILAVLLIIVASPASAAIFAIPDGAGGFVYRDQNTQRSFTAGTLTFPGGWLSAATPEQRAQLGILQVVETPQPEESKNGAANSSIQIVNGIPTVVWQYTLVPVPVFIPTSTVLGRLTEDEYTAIMQAAAAQLAAGNGQLARWLDMARTVQRGINPSDAATVAAIAALEAANLLTPERVAVVFAAP